MIFALQDWVLTVALLITVTVEEILNSCHSWVFLLNSKGKLTLTLMGIRKNIQKTMN